MRRALLLLLVGLVLAAAAPDVPSNREATPEAWIWAQIQSGNDADFNVRCGTERLDPHKPDDPRWADGCRSVDPAALRMLLGRSGSADAPHGVRLRGARIGGTLNLDDLHLTAAEFTLIDSILAGDLVLTSAHLDGSLGIDGTVVTGGVNASAVHIDRSVTINHSTAIAKQVALDSATIGDALLFEGAILADGIDASGIQVGGYLGLLDGEAGGDVLLLIAKVEKAVAITRMKFTGGHQLKASLLQAATLLIDKTDFSGDVSLSQANLASVGLVDVAFAPGTSIDFRGLQSGGVMAAQNVDFAGRLALDGVVTRGNVAMTGVKFGAEGPVTATNIRIGGQFLLRTPPEFPGGITLDAAIIGSDLQAAGIRTGTGKTLNAPGMQVGGTLFLEQAQFGGDVILHGADVRGQVDLGNAKFAPGATLDLEALRVGQDFFFRDATVTEPISAIGLVAPALDLRGSTLGGLDLSGGVIDGDLRLGGQYGNGRVAWTKWATANGKTPLVVLRNAKVGNLQDDTRSWDDAELVLEGFTYTHLGGVGGVNRQDMRYRPVDT